MSNPTISFRISNEHLARGLRAIRIIEPNWKLTTPANLIRTIFNDYVAKSEQLNNTFVEITPELLQEIVISRTVDSRHQVQNEQLAVFPQLGSQHNLK
jgi:hypothetical protein